MKYYIITFGCQMNESDSERIAAVLEKIGYPKAQKIDGTDLIVVNMCSVRQSAVDRIFGLCQKFAKLKSQNSKLKTILTGCILKEDRKKFAKKFDLILDIKDLPNWPKLEKLKTQNAKRKTISRFKNYLVIKPKRSNNFSAFVPISNGCNNFCSYCVVPYVRGPLVCRDYKEILREIKDAIEKGSKEIWLLGQNVNRYRSKSKTINFAKLLKMINDIPGNFWLRFTSPHPSDFSNELIETMAKCEKVTPYLNLPVQSGDNKVLKRMSRPYTVEQYKNLVKKIREKIPGICLSTDVIVGFPGETKKQFENTVKLFKQIKFDMAYIAKYSPRNGTMAAKMKDNVSHQEKEKRYNLLTESLKRTALEKNKKYIGKIIKVLATEKKNDFLIGKSFHYKTVKFKGLKNLIGRFVKVKIIEADFFDLKGKLSQPTVC
ncbi:tRNA (N6-isopentenyl adenosine(37)-C2)-methylthiotransferase MiaB [bacterium (Candidatus Gribaldobacteria) CG07_land_8_20_14_0_80_33_18]|uniref:tRNA-2-methylthio-N(6)-dimethylallyladenosine synthase n=1 Tax=bacterium (Candidatus Gribaldobacteria) CG07_land_8_20_14_0_80_33_18 TaxID=2014272 RepID=A0A2M6Z1R5_9BACT|nr:MAG: tRNA (N6-isopentenyl adenosine(37)-C2)-methylthiotransferase MiaB [bacterium (Candidatus Gribaldobacteria) CG07_land_8_20_14_0_80_33_18]PJA00649.1 MAG: tRNA (N6-isopentenyl adenosine(37)-C2)-methylthiotransferase MiaB [bacterium (Candidatus Gribaldobacteria) CG_4_10_14_0_2_um_filter_33_15]